MTNQDLHLTNTNKKVPPRTYGVYGDTGRQLSMYLDDYTLAAGDTAAVYVHRADGSFYSIAATVDTIGQVVTVDMTQMLTCVGLVQCNLNIENSGLGVQSYNFITVCEESASGSPSTKQNGQSVLDLMNEVQKLKAGLITDTRSGNPVYMADGYDGMEVKALKVGIVPAQAGSGTPSPSNPRTISGITSATVTRCGKNIFDINHLAETGITVTSGEAVGTASAFYTAFTAGVHGVLFVSGQRYTMKLNAYTEQNAGSTGNGLVVFFDYTDGTRSNLNLLNTASSFTPYTLTSTSGKDVKQIGFLYSTLGLNVWHLKDFQIEVGTSATDFEAYAEETVTQSLGGTVYGGSANFTNGEIVDNYVKNEIDGNEISTTSSWYSVDIGAGRSTIGFYWYFSYAGFTNMELPASSSGLYCDKLNPVTSTYGNDNPYTISLHAFGTRGATYLAIRVPISDLADTSTEAAAKASMKQWLIDNPLTISYKVEDTTGTQDPADQVTTVKGPNTMFSNSGNIDVEYYADTKIYIANH